MLRWARTDGDHQEADVAEPVGGLVGQLLHEEPQDGAEVALVAGHRHLYRGRHLSVAVTAAGGGQRSGGAAKKNRRNL